MRKIFICTNEECDFVISKAARDMLAERYPIKLEPRIARHFERITL